MYAIAPPPYFRPWCWLAGKPPLVQEHCPFSVIRDDTSTAGGDPTFLCQGTGSFIYLH